MSVSKELSPDIIEIIASELDGIFKGSNIVNQEYRYVFDIDTCYVEETAPNREEQLKDVEAILKDFFDDDFIFNYLLSDDTIASAEFMKILKSLIRNTELNSNYNI